MWPWRRSKTTEDPILTNEILTGTIETLMRIDANVQALLYGEEADDEEN
jgi:hypothetical protein